MRKIALLATLVLAAALTGACRSDSDDGKVDYQVDRRVFTSAEELNGAADTVIEGRVTGSSVAEFTRQPDSSTMIYTVSTVAVTKVHKGTVKPGHTVWVKQPGGTFKGVEYRAERLPLAAESTYLMFLETYPDGGPASLLNQTQAAFTVAPDGSYVAGPGNDLAMTRETLAGS